MKMSTIVNFFIGLQFSMVVFITFTTCLFFHLLQFLPLMGWLFFLTISYHGLDVEMLVSTCILEILYGF